MVVTTQGEHGDIVGPAPLWHEDRLVRVKLTDYVLQLAKLSPAEEVSWRLGHGEGKVAVVHAGRRWAVLRRRGEVSEELRGAWCVGGDLSFEQLYAWGLPKGGEWMVLTAVTHAGFQVRNLWLVETRPSNSQLIEAFVRVPING